MLWITLALLIIITPLAIAGLLAAPWVPTRKAEVKTLLNYLNSITHKNIIVEAGSGSGTISLQLSTNFPESEVIGIEYAWILGLVSLIRKIITKNKAKFIIGNAFNFDYSKADIIICYFMEDSYPKFIKAIKPSLKENTIIILHAWPLREHEADEILKTGNGLSWYIYTKI